MCFERVLGAGALPGKAAPLSTCSPACTPGRWDKGMQLVQRHLGEEASTPVGLLDINSCGQAP